MLTPELEKNIREILNYANDWTLTAEQGRALVAELDRVRGELAERDLAVNALTKSLANIRGDQ